MTAGLKAWRRRAKVVRTERLPRGDEATAVEWCEACRYMHAIDGHVCEHRIPLAKACAACDRQGDE